MALRQVPLQGADFIGRTGPATAASGGPAVYTEKINNGRPCDKSPAAEPCTHPTTPAKPKMPPAKSSQSGLSRVAEASTAAPAVARPAARLRSEIHRRTHAL